MHIVACKNAFYLCIKMDAYSSDAYLGLNSLFIFMMKINVSNNGYQRYEYRCNNCSHYFSSFFLFSFTNNKPIISVSVAPATTVPKINGESISPKTDDRTNAVVIYLAMSINHFPNSFFIA